MIFLELFRIKSLLRFFGVLLVLPIVAIAQTEPPQFMTVDGRLYDSTTPEDPLLDNSVLMKIQVLNPAKTCILYEEEQTVSTLTSNGYFNVRVGSPTTGAESLKRTTNDSGNSMMAVFQNQNASITGRTSGGGGCSYTPAAGDTRYFRYIVTPSTTGVTSTLSPDMQIDSVPQALVAETLQGMSPDGFVQINSDVTQAKANSLFGGSYTTLTGLLAGTSSLYLRNTTNGTLIPSRATDPMTPAAGQIWYDSDDNVMRYYDGTTVQTLGTSGGDPTKLPLAGGTMAGAIDMATNDITDVGHVTQAPQRTFRFGVYTTAQQTSLIATPLIAGHEGTVWYNTTTNKLMFWDGAAEYAVSPVDSVFGRTGAVVAAAGDYTATQITNTAAGNIAATDAQAAINELDTEKVAKSGDTMTGRLNLGPVGVVAGDGGSLGFTELAANGTAQVGFRAPDDVTTGVIWQLPPSDGSAGQVLQTSGAGVLSWANQSIVGADSLDFSHLSDTMTLDASTDIAAAGTNVLSLTNSGTGNSFVVNDQASDTTPFVIDNAGNVGVGIATPNAGLQISNSTGSSTNFLSLKRGSTDWRIYPSDASSGTPSLRIGGTVVGDYAWQFDWSGADANQFKSANSLASQNVINILGAPAQTGKYLAITSQGGSAGDIVSVQSTGAMGIGTTTPGTLLDVAGSITSRPHGTAAGETGKLILRELAAGGTDTATIRAPNAIATSYSLTLPTTAGSSGQVLRTDGTGILTWVNSDASITADSIDFAQLVDSMTLDTSTNITVTGTDVLSVTNTGTGSSFVVNDVASDSSPFVIDTNGNMGVGVSSPVNFETGTGTIYTHINGGGSGELNISSNGSSLGHRGALSFSNSGTRVGYIRTEKSATSAIDAALAFGTNDGTTLSEKMRITQSGQVGIGTTIPGTLLDVAGSVTSRPHGTAAGETGKLILRELAANGTDTVTIRSPDANATSYVLTLPVDDGAVGQVLQTDGSGVLSWVNGGASLISNDALDFDKLSDNMTLDASTDIAASGTNVLSITNSGTGNSFVVNDEASDTTPFVVDANGNVGVGTSTPGALFHINRSAATGTITSVGVAVTGSGTNFLSVFSVGDVISSNYSSSTIASISSDTSLTLVTPFAIDVTGAIYSRVGAVFQAGNVGFGTSIPGKPIHVSSTVDPEITIRARTTASLPAKLSLAGTNTAGSTSQEVHLVAYQPSGGTATDAALDFRVRMNGDVFSSPGTKMTILGSGNVGIGTTIPGTLLDVSGAITSRPNGTGTGQTGQLILRELAAGGTETAAIRAPDAIATSYALTLPASAGAANQVLTTDGAGVLSWTTPASGVPAADSINFTELADALVLDSSTDISATGSNVFSITNSGTGNSFVVNDQASDTSPFVINAIGNVGVGASSPDYSVDVRTASAISQLHVSGTNADSGLYMMGYDADGSYISSGVAYNGTQWTAKSTSASVIGSDDGMIAFFTNIGLTVGNTFVPTERLRITNTGNVGVGTTTAPQKLTVAGQIISGQGNGSVGGYSFLGDAGHDTGMFQNTAGTLELQTQGVARVFADSTGGVGIGTTIPGTILDAAGAITSRPHGTATGETGKIIMRELAANGTDTATIRAPDTVATSYSLTLPTTAGSSGQVLRTDGTGLLTWINSDASIAPDVLDFTHFADTMTLDASTDIGVTGTNVFSVTNTGTGNSFVVNDQASDTSPFVIDANGNVGIGTTTLTNKLNVQATSAGDGFGVSGTGTNAPQFSLYHGATQKAAYGLALSASHYSSSAIADDAVLRATGTTTGSLLLTTQNSGGAIKFASGSTTTNDTVKMTMLNNGNFGIGSTAPTTKLDISDSSAADNFSMQITGTGSADPTITFVRPGVIRWTAGVDQSDSKFKISSTAGGHNFDTQARMAIDTLGNVGIGTTTASQKLTVSGNILASGSITGGVSTDGDALSALTVDFTNINTVRATGASAACGTLNVTNVTDGGYYTLTVLNATTTCTVIQLNGSTANVKLPYGYGGGGAAVSGVVYTFMYDGLTLWVSFVPY